MTEKKQEETKVEPKTKTEDVEKKSASSSTRRIRQQDLNKYDEVNIKNNLTGGLVYIDNKSGNRYYMQTFGDEEIMVIEDLITMKNTKRKFLEGYYLVITDSLSKDYTVDEILKALNMDYLYEGDHKVMLDIDKFINGTAKNIKDKFPKLNKNAQDVILRRAKVLIETDSIGTTETVKYFTELMS